MNAYMLGSRVADNDVWPEAFAEKIGADVIEENRLIERLRECNVGTEAIEQIIFNLIAISDCIICLDRYGDKKTKHKVEYAKSLGKKVYYRHYYGRRSK